MNSNFKGFFKVLMESSQYHPPQEISIEFIESLQTFRRHVLLQKTFAAWKKVHKTSQREENKSFVALDYWNYTTMKKAFASLASATAVAREPVIQNWRVAKYLVIWMAAKLLTNQQLKQTKLRFDRMLLGLLDVIYLQ